MDESMDFEENPQRRSFALAARPNAPTPASVIKQSKDHKKIYFFAITSLHALGVVYGDIGTSPLYVYRSIFENESHPKKEDIEGVLCLIFYAISFVVTFKYLIFVMMADYKGQGGIFALLSLLLHRQSDTTPPSTNQSEERREPLSEDEEGIDLPTLSPREIKIDIPSKHSTHSNNTSNDEDHPPSPLIIPHSMSHGSISNLANLQPSEFLRKPAVISVYTTLSLVGASLLLGDGVITPAISVLSAIEGLKLIGGGFEQAVVPITCIIIFALFMVQRFGTHKMGMMFGPIMILWFASLAALGIYQTSLYPSVFESLNPAKGIMFFVRKGEHGWRLLGSVVLSVTGCEAMFADMGHFGKNPVRFSWLVFVYPALFLNYCGQASLLIRDPSAIEDPFFKSAPHGVFWPLLVLSTLATVIASQALISGAFSIVQQAISDDFMPRMKVIHTNDKIEGQIFIPALNYFLMVVCILLVIAFETSTKLGNAYGLAVCCDMMMTTIFFATLSKFRWKWHPVPWALLIFSWLIVDGSFLSAALLKIPKGGWFPLAFTVVMSTVMVIWREGRSILAKRRAEAQLDFSTLMTEMKAGKFKRCRGTGIFLTPVAHGVPTAMSELLEHIPFLHRNVIFLTIEYLPVPRVEKNHVEIHEMELKGFYRIHARYGYRQAGFISMESLLKECEPLMPDVELRINKVSFFLHREKVRVDKHKWIGHRLLVRIFNILMLVHHNAASGFGIPPTRVITLGAEVLE